MENRKEKIDKNKLREEHSRVSTGKLRGMSIEDLFKELEDFTDVEFGIFNKLLKEKYPEAFSGAVRCLVSKKRINYINSIC